MECCPILEFADLTKFLFDLDTIVEHIDEKKNDYQRIIYSSTDALVGCLKKTLKFILKQLRHVSVQLHRNMSELF